MQVFVATVSIAVVSSTVEDDIANLKQLTKALAKQVMNQQVYFEETVRATGQSGVKQKRRRFSGTRPYYSDTFTSNTMITIHDHANHIRTIGIGEFIAVLNGVEFRTRHNDYGLYMPSRTSREYHAVDPIEFPDVPPEVLSKPTVAKQITEMKQWFKAWRDQKFGYRDYRKYFKPIMCYLEGAWTIADPNKIDEPFASDRHVFTVLDWDEMSRKIRFMSNAGSKDNNENFAFLPTALFDMRNDTTPFYAQWNYRILCHPLKKYVQPNRLRVVDDLASRVANGFNLERFKNSRGARFQLNPIDSAVFSERFKNDRRFLDQLMEEIPGKDNYGKWMSDQAFGLDAKRVDNSSRMLNAANYHRTYKVMQRGANGIQQRSRGFADDGVYMARNSQSKIATNIVNHRCYHNNQGEKLCRERFEQKWSYAIPLEIIYLTPLHKWNPFNITYIDDGKQCGKCKGGNTKETAYQFASRSYYYRTPASFFTGDPVDGDAADTSGQSVGMLDANGNLHKVRASGVYVGLPEIKDVGILRTRYPIAPVHQEGEAVWKELQALKDLLFKTGDRFKALRDDYGINDLPGEGEGPSEPDTMLAMANAPNNDTTGVSAHTHSVQLSPEEVQQLQAGQVVDVTSGMGSSHTHTLKVSYNADRVPPYYYTKCDNRDTCWDGHGKSLRVESSL